MQYVGGEEFTGKKTVATAVNFPGGGAAHLSGLPNGTTCSLAKRSASEEIAVQVAEESARVCSLAKRSAGEEMAVQVAEENATVVGEGLLGAKAPRPSGRCLRQRSLADAQVEP